MDHGVPGSHRRRRASSVRMRARRAWHTRVESAVAVVGDTSPLRPLTKFATAVQVGRAAGVESDGAVVALSEANVSGSQDAAQRMGERVGSRANAADVRAQRGRDTGPVMALWARIPVTALPVPPSWMSIGSGDRGVERALAVLSSLNQDRALRAGVGDRVARGVEVALEVADPARLSQANSVTHAQSHQ